MLIKKVGIGVIGLGVMGNIFCKIIKENPLTKLIAITGSRDLNKIKKLSKYYDTKGYKDYLDLIKDKAIQAVFICLPEREHLKPAIIAIKLGKHIFIEKPICSSLLGANEVIFEAKRNNIKLMVGHTLRFDPRFFLANEAIKNGEIGEIIHIYTRRNSYVKRAKKYQKRTNVIRFLGIHDVDIVNWFVGKRVVRVFAESNAGNIVGFPNNNSVFSTIKFKNGTVALMENSWAINNYSKVIVDKLRIQVEVVGTKGTILIDGSLNSGLSISGKRGTYYPDTMYFTSAQGKITGVYSQEVMHFAECITLNKEPVLSGEEAKKALLIIDALSQSLNLNKIIYL